MEKSDNFLVQIRNYQRIRSAKLEFLPGLNVIVGESNQGKTAVFRALETALFNISRESHVTIGETKSAVGIRYRGHEVIWRRDNDAPSPMSYRIDGKILTKLGRGQPKIIADLLGISEVELDDIKMKLNFQKQMKYPFLLDKTPSQMFKFIVQSAEEDNVMDVIQTMKTDMNTISVNVKAYEEARESLRIAYMREVKRFRDKKPVLPYCERVINTDAKVKKYSQLKKLVEELKDLMQTIVDSEEELSTVKTVVTRLDSSVGKLQGSYDRLDNISTWTGQYTGLVLEEADLRGHLKELREEMKTFDGLDEKVEKVQNLDGLIKQRQGLTGVVEDIKDRERSKSMYEMTLSALKIENTNLENMATRVDQAIQFCEDTKERMSGIESLVAEILSIKEEKAQVEGRYKKVSKEIEDVQKEIDSFDVCPFCGSPVGGNEHERCAGS